MIPEHNQFRSEFASLLGSAPNQEPDALRHVLPSIARAGIDIIFPPRKIDNYLSLLTREISLKGAFLSQRQTISCLRLRGLPLRQCDPEQLTELIFRLCFKYRVLDGQEGERLIALSVEQCTSDNLALFKGLGFNNIRLVIDASIAAADRSLEPVAKALTVINGYSGFAVTGAVAYSSETSPEYLRRLVDYLTGNRIAEVEVLWDTFGPVPAGSRLNCERVFEVLAEALQQAGYRLLGDRNFVCPGHPNLQLLESRKLGFGPWGFCNGSVSDWLGLGVGAEGMIAGYLYHNFSNADDYRNRVLADQSPVAAWSHHSLAGDLAFEFIRQLYCEHSARSTLFEGRAELLKSLVSKGWLTVEGSQCQLTRRGVANLNSICNLYISSQDTDNGKQQAP